MRVFYCRLQKYKGTLSNIVKFLDRKCSVLDALIDEKESLIANLEAYKKSLVYEVVTGKKRVF